MPGSSVLRILQWLRMEAAETEPIKRLYMPWKDCNASGDIEPCAFMHYFDINIREKTLLQAYRSHSGAKSTDYQNLKTAGEFSDKCVEAAENRAFTADKLWEQSHGVLPFAGCKKCAERKEKYP